jgi:hypothetical protein
MNRVNIFIKIVVVISGVMSFIIAGILAYKGDVVEIITGILIFLAGINIIFCYPKLLKNKKN